MRKVYLLILSIFFFVGVNAQTTLPTSWDFDTPAVTGTAPTGWVYGIGINGTGGLTYSASLGGGTLAARLDATGEYISIFFADKPGQLSYYARGTGFAASGPPVPSFTGQFDIQESSDGTNWSALRSFTNAVPIPGTVTKFIDQPAASTRYIRFYYTSKLSGSNVQLDSVLLKAAPAGNSSSLNVKFGSNSIVNNSVSVVGSSSSVNFTLENLGTGQTLTINSINISGPAASDFSIGTIPSEILASANQQFSVNFTPSTNGSRYALLTINNSDSNKNPFTITLLGIGGSLASEPTQSPSSINISNIKTFGFKVAFNAPTVKPDKYIVLRKMGNSLIEFPVDGKTYLRGDAIGGAKVAYVGDSILTNYQPTYIFANTPYTFAVFSFNGPSGFENYLTTSSASSTVTTLGKQPGSYYSGIDPNVSTFISQLTSKINPHFSQFYGSYAPRLMTAYVVRDTTGGKFVANCVYTNLPYIYDGGFLWKSSSNGANLSREHTFPQSWMQAILGSAASNWPNDASNTAELPQYNDMHHLFPADQDLANVIRSNYTFGNVVNATNTSPTGKGKLGTDASGAKTVYEPRDEHKGAAARAMMYMSVCYNTPTYNWGFPKNNITTRGDQDTAVLMQWHRQYPPSNFEIARHEFIYGLQNNRNPFIDNPEWAQRINFNNMTYKSSTVTDLKTSNTVSANSISVYPNPTSEDIIIDASIIFSENINYEILDTKGVIVAKGELKTPISTIQMPGNQGLYLLNIQTENGKVIRKIAKN